MVDDPAENPVLAKRAENGASELSSSAPLTPLPTADETYRYEAFVSYRHAARDRAWAKWLHAGLESYRVPDTLVRRGLRARLGRVFRDEDELSASTSLSEEIEQALRASRHLIVVCSRATPASRWVNEEVLRFRQLGREQRIRVLLVEGEPHESFPPALHQLVSSGPGQPPPTPPGEALDSAEPLAADVRPQPGESARLIRRLALLRLIAPLLGCRFDDLRQRESERALRRLRAIVGAAIAAVVIVGALAATAVIQRNRATQRLTQMLVERGREEWLGGSAARALPFLSSAYELDPASPAVQLLLGQVLPRVEPRFSVMAGRGTVPPDALVSRDGSRLVAIGGKSGVSVWDLSGARLVSVLGDERSLFADATDDGRYVLTRDPDGALAVWDTRGGELVKRMAALGPSLRQARLSHDASRVAARYADGLVETWQVGSAERLHAWRPEPAAEAGPNKPTPLTDIAFSPDGSRILTVGFDGMVRLWDAEKSKLIFLIDAGARTSMPLNKYRYRSGAVKWAAIHPDGTLLVTLTLEGVASVWDAATGRFVKTIEASPPPGVWPAGETPKVEISSLRFSDDQRQLLVSASAPTWSAGGFFALWDIRAGRSGAALRTGSMDRARLDHSGKHVVTAGDDGLKVWSLGTGELVARVESPSFTAWFTPDGRSIVSTSWDGTVNVWPLEPLSAVRLEGHKKAVQAAAFSFDSRRVVTASKDRTARVWEVETGKLLSTDSDHDEEVVDVALDRQGSLAVSTSYDGVATIVQADTGVSVGDLVPPEGGLDLLAARFLPDGQRIVSVGRDKTIRVWDTSRRVQKLRLPGKALVCLPAPSFSPDGSLAVTVEGDQATIWSTADGSAVSTLAGRWLCAAFSPDGRRLLSKEAGAFAPMHIWDTTTGRLVSSLPNLEGSQWVVAFSPDNALVATAFTQKGATVWDARRGRMLAEIDAQARINALAFTPDGRFVVTAGERGARLWDPARGSLLAAFDAEAEVLWAGFSPDGARLVTTGANGHATIWRMALEARDPAQIARLGRCYAPWRLGDGALVSEPIRPAECSAR